MSAILWLKTGKEGIQWRGYTKITDQLHRLVIPYKNIFTTVYLILSSIALPLETVMLSLYAANLFGDHSFDRIMGMFISVNTAGYAVGTPFVNLGFDLTGSYRGVLLLTAGIMLAVTIAMQFVISSAHKLRTDLSETEVV